MSVNKVILIGNVGKDPDVRYLDTGIAVATFSLATTDRMPIRCRMEHRFPNVRNGIISCYGEAVWPKLRKNMSVRATNST